MHLKNSTLSTEKVHQYNCDGFEWIDIISPSKEDLAIIAERLSLHPASVEDCLDPEHLPKLESFPGVTFFILRLYDDTSAKDIDTVRALTRKLAIFYSDHFILTLHRLDLDMMLPLREKWEKRFQTAFVKSDKEELLSDLILNSILSYNHSVMQLAEKVEVLENRILSSQTSPGIVTRLFRIKRRCGVYKKMIYLIHDVVRKMKISFDASLCQNLEEAADRMYFLTESVFENSASLITLHLSISSHRTNEVMRVLTIFSVFFMPVSFIAALYGMNFEYMPELKSIYGYPAVLLGMLSITGTIFFWFRHKGWLQ